MNTLLLSGNEAIAEGAREAGALFASATPVLPVP
jgi:pyruvate/2-oxoacid:ferredoxin oxidoreductase alpha subunit